jgi:hypothetical protein
MNSPEPFEGRGIRRDPTFPGRPATKKIEIHTSSKNSGPGGVSFSLSKAFVNPESSKAGSGRGHPASVWHMET